MSAIQQFEELEAWKTSLKLATLIYDLTNVGAFAKDFCLKDQIRRAVISAMSNISEGFDSRTKRGFVHFLGIARASLSETKCQLYLALDLHYIGQEKFDSAYELCDKSARQISKLIKYLESNK